MPALDKVLAADLSKYKLIDTPLPPVVSSMERQALSTIRCPLPPFNATPDTLRQFDNNGQTPQVRLVPLPLQSSTSITKTTTTISSGTSSSSSSSASLTSATVVITTPVIVPSGVYTGTISIAKACLLLNLTANAPCDIRLYGSAVAQAADSARLTDIPVPFEESSGFISNVVFDTAPYSWNWQNRIAVNNDSPQTTTIYVTVVNPDTVNPIAPTITVGYVGVES